MHILLACGFKNKYEKHPSVCVRKALDLMKGRHRTSFAMINAALAVLKQKYQRSQPEYEKYGVIVISSLYGLDLLEDNVEECRERLLKI